MGENLERLHVAGGHPIIKKFEGLGGRMSIISLKKCVLSKIWCLEKIKKNKDNLGKQK